jgi:hypothetical protein
MSTRPTKYPDLLDFSSRHPLQYGQSIRILGEPVKQNGHWVANALLSPAGSEEILLKTGRLKGSQFIVVRTEASGKQFLHSAVLVDEIENVSRRIESSIAGLLKV